MAMSLAYPWRSENEGMRYLHWKREEGATVHTDKIDHPDQLTAISIADTSIRHTPYAEIGQKRTTTSQLTLPERANKEPANNASAQCGASLDKRRTDATNSPRLLTPWPTSQQPLDPGVPYP